MAQSVPTTNISFPGEEEKILKYWKEIDAFRTSLKQSKGKPRYTFYDGPPFATGLPHYGHILAGTIKDVVTRWAHQTGFHVDRRFGWDCHGLPVEYEIDKTLGIKGPEDVEKMGIAAYNAECRKIVMRYSTDWEEIVTRLGRWIDFENDYKTMYPSFMESIWWVFKELYNKGLVYKGSKVMPFSTACNTPLSNFESGQNYKDVVDPAVIVNFPLLDDPDVAIIAWTTTPWTLPSNLSVCVNPDMDYIKVKDKSTGKVYIMMEARLEALFKKADEYTILEKFKGRTLEGKKYEPVFPYFKYMREQTGAFRVLMDDYVTAESGTGIVHQAPYFGEDDYRVCLKYGIITRDMKIICPVDASGKFTNQVTDFKGQYVKDADKAISKNLKERGRLVHQSTFKHSYPFCWRSETPLIYKAVPSWFVRVEQATTQLLENNQKTYWVPDFVKEKRFANWLREARDWAISRNRYWGTPIPLWISEDGEEIVCVGSVEELKRLSGVEVKDLHRESVDNITIPSKLGKGVLRRTSEVFDCWFESGSMPYAQVHYPFERKKEFDDTFPADFIAEGIDQTRGWFYTLLVLSTLLFGKPPFKNLIVNGIVLAEDGNKMSKRLKNYPDPMLIVHKYGADALRLYLCNSPAVKAEGLKFKEEGVERVLKDVFLPWYNAYRFFMQNVDRYQTEEGLEFLYNESKITKRSNYKDRWIMSLAQSLIKFVRMEMQAYRLYTVMPRLVKFVDQLTNWYVRMNRKRLKGEGGLDDCREALETLFSVLMTMIRLMAPMIPYITEHMFQNLRKLIDPRSVGDQDIRSVHFLQIPTYRDDLIDTSIERAVSRMQSVIELGRVTRERNTLPLKYPLKEVVAIHRDPEALEDIKSLQSYIMEELNVKSVKVTQDKSSFGAHLVAEADFKTLGAKLKVLVLLDIVPDQSMLDEGVAREVINRVQKLRQKGGLVPSDKITVYYKASENLGKIISEFNEYICNAIKQPFLPFPVPPSETVFLQETMDVKKEKLEMAIVKQGESSGPLATASFLSPAPAKNTPFCKFVNAVLVGMPSQEGVEGNQATVLLENPTGNGFKDLQQLIDQIKAVFGVRGRRVILYTDSGLKNELPSTTKPASLAGQTLYVGPLSGAEGVSYSAVATPVCHFVNVEYSKGGNKKGTLVLENPRGNTFNFEQLLSQASAVYSLNSKNAVLSRTKDKTGALSADSTKNIIDLHGSTLQLLMH
ncbi:isoleucine--tRNA ligase, cytoplasmic-like isoform X2 [Ostrea edulis]|uniref:isoleucine--tRNA ligase, cytoplasmic-like isoform X2 n=1 Tax=Ostrea edulis TaxID=37623 RepID=UPI0024AFA54B|nr:isoleucine--tRNA ligase, cytoplasmic-like isoform X2 [Ostrea edulis]